LVYFTAIWQWLIGIGIFRVIFSAELLRKMIFQNKCPLRSESSRENSWIASRTNANDEELKKVFIVSNKKSSRILLHSRKSYHSLSKNFRQFFKCFFSSFFSVSAILQSYFCTDCLCYMYSWCLLSACQLRKQKPDLKSNSTSELCKARACKNHLF
jgi:hypothetical protein